MPLSVLPVTPPPANTVPKTAAVVAERAVLAETEISTAKEKADMGMVIAIATERGTAMEMDTAIPVADTGTVVTEKAEEMVTVEGRAREMAMDGGTVHATGTTAAETATETAEGIVSMKAEERVPETATVAGNHEMMAKVEENQKAKLLQFQILQSGKRADGTVNFLKNGGGERICSICHKRSLFLGGQQ